MHLGSSGVLTPLKIFVKICEHTCIRWYTWWLAHLSMGGEAGEVKEVIFTMKQWPDTGPNPGPTCPVTDSAVVRPQSWWPNARAKRWLDALLLSPVNADNLTRCCIRSWKADTSSHVLGALEPLWKWPDVWVLALISASGRALAVVCARGLCHWSTRPVVL
jgi:hypothetical protein